MFAYQQKHKLPQISNILRGTESANNQEGDWVSIPTDLPVHMPTDLASPDRDLRDDDIAGALRTVVLHVLTDAFGLLPEESLWAGFRLDTILEPLQGLSVDAVPMAVRQEILTGEYGRALGRAETEAVPTPAPVADPMRLHASTSDWAGVLMLMITVCFDLPSIVEGSLHAQLMELLREIGVGQRPARYLPNDVRSRLAQQPSAMKPNGPSQFT